MIPGAQIKIGTILFPLGLGSRSNSGESELIHLQGTEPWPLLTLSMHNGGFKIGGEKIIY